MWCGRGFTVQALPQGHPADSGSIQSGRHLAASPKFNTSGSGLPAPAACPRSLPSTGAQSRADSRAAAPPPARAASVPEGPRPSRGRPAPVRTSHPAASGAAQVSAGPMATRPRATGGGAEAGAGDGRRAPHNASHQARGARRKDGGAPGAGIYGPRLSRLRLTIGQRPAQTAGSCSPTASGAGRGVGSQWAEREDGRPFRGGWRNR